MDLHKIINKIRINMCLSLTQEPCTFEVLIRRPFLKNVSLSGMQTAREGLLRDDVISEGPGGVLTVNFKGGYQGLPENIF